MAQNTEKEKIFLNIFAPYIFILSIISLSIFSSSCQKSHSSGSLSVGADYITLSGTVKTPGDVPLDNVSIFIDISPDSSMVTNQNGEFRLTMKESKIAEIKALIADSRETFRLYFESILSDPKMIAASRVINLSERGKINLGDITLQPAATLSGQVKMLEAGGKYVPAQNAKVSAGHAAALSDEQGNFTLQNVPAGTIEVVAQKEDLSPAKTTLEILPGETKTLDQPLILFPPDVVAGFVTEVSLSEEDLHVLQESGHPYQRQFAVMYSPKAAFFRYTYDNKLLETESKNSPWQSIRQSLSYDFPQVGNYNFYIQFADESKTELSEVITLRVSIDLFSDSTGFVIEDGSGFVTKRTVTLHVDLPNAAKYMKFSNNIDVLDKKPWLTAQPVTEFIIQNGLEMAPTSSENIINGHQTIYGKFSDGQGNESQVYSAPVILELFPEDSETMFTIEGGAEKTANHLVKLAINVPQNAYQMRIYEDGSSISINTNWMGMQQQSSTGLYTWYAAQPEFFYNFSIGGLKRLYLQFRDRDHFVSPTYAQTIMVEPFTQQEIGFTINDDISPTTDNRQITINLNPPVGATRFRIHEDCPPEVSDFSWLNLVPNMPYTTERVGQVTIYLQYQNDFGDISDIYSQSIFIDPFQSGSGDFMINGGMITTDSPLLQLDILPPTAATEMAVGEVVNGHIPETSLDTWQVLAPHVDFMTVHQGLKTIYVRFKTIEGDVSPAIIKNIIYNPFPGSSILINNGDPTTNNRVVNLAIAIPVSAIGMRISHNLNDLVVGLGIPFQNLMQNISYTLPNESGLYTVYVQFITLEGEISNAFFDQITLNL